MSKDMDKLTFPKEWIYNKNIKTIAECMFGIAFILGLVCLVFFTVAFEYFAEDKIE